MTSKKKAKEIFKSMYNKIFDIDMGANVMHDKKRFDAAKLCALIAVGEILNELVLSDFKDKGIFTGQKEYWQQVKVEIESKQYSSLRKGLLAVAVFVAVSAW